MLNVDFESWLYVGVPSLLQEGGCFDPADGAQADRPKAGWCQEGSKEEEEEGLRPEPS